MAGRATRTVGERILRAAAAAETRIHRVSVPEYSNRFSDLRMDKVWNNECLGKRVTVSLTTNLAAISMVTGNGGVNCLSSDNEFTAIGIERLLRLYEALGVRGTFFVPGEACSVIPASVHAIDAAGHELALGRFGQCHSTCTSGQPGYNISKKEDKEENMAKAIGMTGICTDLNSMENAGARTNIYCEEGGGEQEEEWSIMRSLELLREHTLQNIVGFRAHSLTPSTIKLLAKHNFLYDSSSSGKMVSDFDLYPSKHNSGDDEQNNATQQQQSHKMRLSSMSQYPLLHQHHRFGEEIVEVPAPWAQSDHPVSPNTGCFSAGRLRSPKGGAAAETSSHAGIYGCGTMRTATDISTMWQGNFEYLYGEVNRGQFTLTTHPEVMGRGDMIHEIGDWLWDLRARPGVSFRQCRDAVAIWLHGQHRRKAALDAVANLTGRESCKTTLAVAAATTASTFKIDASCPADKLCVLDLDDHREVAELFACTYASRHPLCRMLRLKDIDLLPWAADVAWLALEGGLAFGIRIEADNTTENTSLDNSRNMCSSSSSSSSSSTSCGRGSGRGRDGGDGALGAVLLGMDVFEGTKACSEGRIRWPEHGKPVTTLHEGLRNLAFSNNLSDGGGNDSLWPPELPGQYLQVMMAARAYQGTQEDATTSAVAVCAKSVTARLFMAAESQARSLGYHAIFCEPASAVSQWIVSQKLGLDTLAHIDYETFRHTDGSQPFSLAATGLSSPERNALCCTLTARFLQK